MNILEKIKSNLAKEINQALGTSAGSLQKGGQAVQASDLVCPPGQKMGDLSLSCFEIAKKLKKNPNEIAKGLAKELSSEASELSSFSAVGPYLNFTINKEYLTKKVLSEINKQKNKYGQNKDLRGKTVMVEYTDPNPFKEFHIGHLVTNAIGESIARIIKSCGAKKVWRANYQGDVGLHVAMAVWGMKKKNLTPEGGLEAKAQKLGQAYALGATGYKKDEQIKSEIEEINKKIYERTDKGINRLYDQGRKISLDYFETIYKKLGTSFDDYFFESRVGVLGKKIIAENSKIFFRSQGAVIFKGEDYGLHTRVFLNSEGLPTYEAKELGLIEAKFKKRRPDVNITITGNEIKEYFRVMLKVMELINPDWAKKTIHIPHGMLKLPTGKMSSRTGEVISANSLIAATAAVVNKKMGEKDEKRVEKISIGAIKYSILKSGPGRDIVFDFDKSISFSGDSGPYLQYTYARIQSIIRKSQIIDHGSQINFKNLKEGKEHNLILQLAKYPEMVEKAGKNYDPSELAKYLFDLAQIFNDYYHHVPVLKAEEKTRLARLVLINSVAQVLKNGLELLGIEVVDKM